MITDILFGLMGLAALLSIAWVFSPRKDAIDWRTIGMGIVLQLVFAVFVLLTPLGATVFEALANVFVIVIGFTRAGSTFLFGELATSTEFGFMFAFQVLPSIIFFASLMAVLYHIGAVQKVVQAVAWGILAHIF